jgi:hypothetical protein
MDVQVIEGQNIVHLRSFVSRPSPSQPYFVPFLLATFGSIYHHNACGVAIQHDEYSQRSFQIQPGA